MGVRSGKGDKGYTELAFKDRIRKDSQDMRAIGDLDELMSYLGLIKVKTRSKKYKVILEKIQSIVSTAATEIAVGSERKRELGDLLKKKEADWIEKVLFDLEAKVKIENCFHISGYNETSAFTDIARAVARRAERSVVALYHKDKMLNNYILLFLNCVSDILFLMARHQSKQGKKKKTKHKKTLPGK